jgi:hypothetical protein
MMGNAAMLYANERTATVRKKWTVNSLFRPPTSLCHHDPASPLSHLHLAPFFAGRSAVPKALHIRS